MSQRVTRAEAARQLGIHRTTVGRWIERGWLREDADQTVDLADAQAVAATLARLPKAPDAEEVHVAAGAQEQKPRFSFDAEGRYVFHTTGDFGDVAISKADIRAMRRAYSKFGGNATMNQICTDFGLPRQVFYAVKVALSWTKDDLPFTDEEIVEESTDALVQDYLTIKRQGLARKLQAAHLRDLKKRADAGDRAGEVVERSVAEVLERFTYQPLAAPVTVNPGPTVLLRRRYLLCVSPTDLHYGKLGWSGFGPGAFDRKECVRRLSTSTARLMADIPYRPEKVALYVGSDWVHIDSSKGTTTKGTPQDMDGVPEQIATEALALLFDTVRAWENIGYGDEQGVTLEIYLKAGNHDKLLAYTYFEALRQAYRGSKHVRVMPTLSQYTIHRYGASMVMATHGDGRSSCRDLAEVMATHEPAIWGATRYKYAFRGNLHHVRVEEGNGILSMLWPSLSGSDRYHQTHWPVHGRALLEAVAIDFDLGKFATLSACPDL